MNISFILSGRDDGYMRNFMERFSTMLAHNLSALDESLIDYEFIVVDFNPIDNQYLFNNEMVSGYLSHQRVKNIIVDRSVLIDDNLSPTSFYEYFAKNIGARKSNGKILFFTNLDIIITSEIIDYINSEIDSPRLMKSFYRCSRRTNIEFKGSQRTIVSDVDLYNESNPDGFLCGGYSGDATFMHRDVFIKIATGYNETMPEHRLGNGQTGMDGEILWNLHFKGIEPVITGLQYFHINHERDSGKNYAYFQEKYTNRKNWGYIKYPTKSINDNTILMYK